MPLRIFCLKRSFWMQAPILHLQINELPKLEFVLKPKMVYSALQKKVLSSFNMNLVCYLPQFGWFINQRKRDWWSWEGAGVLWIQMEILNNTKNTYFLNHFLHTTACCNHTPTKSSFWNEPKQKIGHKGLNQFRSAVSIEKRCLWQRKWTCSLSEWGFSPKAQTTMLSFWMLFDLEKQLSKA